MRDFFFFSDWEINIVIWNFHTVEQLYIHHVKPYLIDEKLELDDGCSALVLTVALHTWTAESGRLRVKKSTVTSTGRTRTALTCI